MTLELGGRQGYLGNKFEEAGTGLHLLVYG